MIKLCNPHIFAEVKVTDNLVHLSELDWYQFTNDEVA